ncbi:MAG: hypothetical protein AB1689_09940 [Thermodesulfobacteriota bacterium]
MRTVAGILAVAGAALLLALASSVAHAQRESGIQCTSDRSGVLINKVVGNESWVITWRVRDGYTTGNVLSRSGGVTFLSCDLDSIDSGMVNLACSVSGSCSATSCPAYTPVGSEPIGIPCSFFSAPCSPIPGRPGTNSETCAGTPPRYPYDSEASCADFAAAGGCASYQYTSNSCVVSNCCTPLDCP